MTKRAGKQYEQQPQKWYVEAHATDEQIFAALEHELDDELLIWDASCGRGTMLDVALGRGHPTFGSDIIDRPQRTGAHPFVVADFLKLRSLPFRRRLGQRVALFCNPPYGRDKERDVDDLATEFMHHAVTVFADELELAVFLLPIERMCGQERYARIYSKRRPAYSLICCERPSMPPGEMLGSANAGKGGMADYCALVWKRGGPYRCETIFMPPSSRPIASSSRRTK